MHASWYAHELPDWVLESPKILVTGPDGSGSGGVTIVLPSSVGRAEQSTNASLTAIPRGIPGGLAVAGHRLSTPPVGWSAPKAFAVKGMVGAVADFSGRSTFQSVVSGQNWPTHGVWPLAGVAHP